MRALVVHSRDKMNDRPVLSGYKVAAVEAVGVTSQGNTVGDCPIKSLDEYCRRHPRPNTYYY